MREVSENLFVGSLEDSRDLEDKRDWAIVHACKTPSHQQAVGYEKSLPADHPHYLVFLRGTDLFLNMVDMPKEFSPKFTDPMVTAAFKFIKKNLDEERKVIIHCNNGGSRGPSLALAYMAYKGLIAAGSYEEAVKEFQELYPEHAPNTGISAYLKNNWHRIMAF